MNSHALFVYKDDLAFTMNPTKPAIVVPLSEISKVELGCIDKHNTAQVVGGTNRPVQTTSLAAKQQSAQQSSTKSVKELK